MSLQRRLLIYLLICAPIAWGVALLLSIQSARVEVNELFDTELIRLARQVQVTLRPEMAAAELAEPPAAAQAPATPASHNIGEADVKDLSVAVWDAKGRLLLADREGADLPRRADATGFVDLPIKGELWRVYYLQSFDGQWLVAAGQKEYERDEVVFDLSVSQLVPWLVVLPLLLVAMAWAVRRALAPVHVLADELQARGADDLHAVPLEQAPLELKPMVAAMNGLFSRIESTLARERRFTADAAHELRTPLAVLRAQWDVLRRSGNEAERQVSEQRLGLGIDRLDRLVTQMLALSRVEARAEASGPVVSQDEVNWPRVVEQVFSDCLPLAERRHIELACEWPAPGTSQHPFPLLGDEHLLTVMLRNLMDNAVRYAPTGTPVTLRMGTERLEIDNDGEPLSPEQRARLGERFYRPDGQDEGGSGLGLSIVQRIAALHGLEVAFGTRDDGRGVRVTVRFVAAPAG